MKTIILSAMAMAALTGAASADIVNESTGMAVERRTDARGNSFWVYVRPAQQATTVAVFRGGKTRQAASENRSMVSTHRDDAHGRTTTTYRSAR